MTTTLLLTAFPPETRLAILRLLELSELRAILRRASGDSHSCCLQIAASDEISSTVEITIQHTP